MDALPPSPQPSKLGKHEERQRRSLRMRPELWQGLDALARGQGVSTNALLELIAERVVGGGAGAEDGEREQEQEGEASDARGKYKGVHIRLREMDRAELREQAAATGHTLTGWVTAVLRARSRKAPLLAICETEALVEANRQLAAVGRNLNTVVHRLHREGRWAGNLDLYARLLEAVKRHRARIEAVIASAHERAEEV